MDVYRSLLLAPTTVYAWYQTEINILCPKLWFHGLGMSSRYASLAPSSFATVISEIELNWRKQEDRYRGRKLSADRRVSSCIPHLTTLRYMYARGHIESRTGSAEENRYGPNPIEQQWFIKMLKGIAKIIIDNDNASSWQHAFTRTCFAICELDTPTRHRLSIKPIDPISRTGSIQLCIWFARMHAVASPNNHPITVDQTANSYFPHVAVCTYTASRVGSNSLFRKAGPLSVAARTLLHHCSFCSKARTGHSRTSCD